MYTVHTFSAYNSFSYAGISVLVLTLPLTKRWSCKISHHAAAAAMSPVACVNCHYHKTLTCVNPRSSWSSWSQQMCAKCVMCALVHRAKLHGASSSIIIDDNRHPCSSLRSCSSSSSNNPATQQQRLAILSIQLIHHLTFCHTMTRCR